MDDSGRGACPRYIRMPIYLDDREQSRADFAGGWDYIMVLFRPPCDCRIEKIKSNADTVRADQW